MGWRGAGETPQSLRTHIPALELWPRAEEGPSGLWATEGERPLCPDGCGPKSLPLQLPLGWSGPNASSFPGMLCLDQPLGSSRFSMSHFEILNTISSLPVLLRGSPLHRGDSLPSWSKGTKSPLGCGTLEGLCLPPMEPGTTPIRWVPLGLRLKPLPCFPHTARGRSGTWDTATL